MLYASKAEATRALELDMLKRIGEVREYYCQVPYPLYGKNGGKVCVHVVDFKVHYANGTVEVEDVKGIKTAAWSIKHKLFCDNYKIPYRVVQRKERPSRGPRGRAVRTS